MSTHKKNSAIAKMAAQCCTIRFSQSSLEYMCLTQSFPVNSGNISTKHTLPKSKFLNWAIRFCCRQYGCNFNHYGIIGPCKLQSYGIRWNNAKERWLRRSEYFKNNYLVPMESLYATSYVSIIVTCLISCTVSEIRWIICPIFAVDRGCLSFTQSFTHWLGVNPYNHRQIY